MAVYDAADGIPKALKIRILIQIDPIYEHAEVERDRPLATLVAEAGYSGANRISFDMLHNWLAYRSM